MPTSVKVPKFQYLLTDLLEIPDWLQEYSNKARLDIHPISELSSLSGKSETDFVQVVVYISESTLEYSHSQIHDTLKFNPSVLTLFLIRGRQLDFNGFSQTKIEEELFFGTILENSPPAYVLRNLANAFNQLQMTKERFELKHRINISSNEISKLTKIGMSLAYEKDFTKLLRYILDSAREISNADSGSLYLVEKDDKGNPRNLRFKISALSLESDEFILAIDKKSIAGYVATTCKSLNIPDLYKLSGEEEYKFNSAFDQMSNYHSKSMLTVPMKNHYDEVIGVIQLINRKKNFHQKLTPDQMNSEMVMPFDAYSEELVMAVAGQAAVAIQNNNLLQEIETLFEGFVTASVSAIEARDPTTSGHSFRVAVLTVGLAEAVNQTITGEFAKVQFTPTQIKEIRYASLLHDFGKVGVREKVLVKAKKLEDYDIDLIRWRFGFVRKDLEAKFAHRKIEFLKKHGMTNFDNFEKALELEYKMDVEKLEEMLDTILRSNEPSVLEESQSSFLEEISKTHYHSTDGNELHLLQPTEFRYLSIRKGSLDMQERREIESHVEHTFQFLSKIPWTSGLKMVPGIAHAHHEKLNGKGYPRGLTSEEIPVQSKMMAIADIFDALTDKDRPYKKAVPLDRALDILKMEVKDHHVDGGLLDIFIEARIFDKVIHKKLT